MRKRFSWRAFAACYALVFPPLAAFGFLSSWSRGMAAFGHSSGRDATVADKVVDGLSNLPFGERACSSIVANWAFWAAVPALVAAVVLGKQHERQHKRNSLRLKVCHACGYDLRSTPSQCPECGTWQLP